MLSLARLGTAIPVVAGWAIRQTDSIFTPLLAEVLLSLDNHLEKLYYFCQSNLCTVWDTYQVKQRLSINKLLGNDRIWLTKRPYAYSTRIHLHCLQKTGDFDRVTLSTTVKRKVVDMESDEINLSLQVEAKPNHSWPTKLVPCVGYLLETIRDQMALVQFTRYVVIQDSS